MNKQQRLGQFMTPTWVAAELFDIYFGDLGSDARFVEPSCGRGAFLQAIPSHLPAVGVEIDPELAHEAVRITDRQVIVGDFRMVDLPFVPTALVGNPPFSKRTILDFLERAWNLLPDEGRCGFIVPAFVFQTANTVDDLAKRWSIRQDFLPRNVFGKLSHPLCFALFTKSRERLLTGFTLYSEVSAIHRLQARYKALLADGEGSVWAAVVRAALEQLGGTSDLARLYREIEGHRPTTNKFWQAKVRQTLQRIAHRVSDGVWKLPAERLAA